MREKEVASKQTPLEIRMRAFSQAACDAFNLPIPRPTAADRNLAYGNAVREAALLIMEAHKTNTSPEELLNGVRKYSPTLSSEHVLKPMATALTFLRAGLLVKEGLI